MKLYKGGDDVLDTYDLELLPNDVVSFAYDYQIGDYCGSGFCVALAIDGLVYVHDMSHCSCYGPMTHFNATKYKIENLKDSLSLAFYEGIKPLLVHL